MEARAARQGRRACGFTLIEVLVALLVVAIALAAIIGTITQAIDNTAALRDRNVALWVAQNRLTLHRLRRDWPSPDTRDGTTEMGHREWRWREQVSATPDPDLRRIKIEVRADKQPQVLATLVGYLINPAAGP